MSSAKIVLSIIIITGIFFFAAAGKAEAADRYWIATSNAGWNSTNNWSDTSGGTSGASVPGSTDAAHFDGNGRGNCGINAAVNVAGISIGAFYGKTIQQAGYSVTVGLGGYTQASGTFTGGSGTGGSGTITFSSGAFSLSGGTFTATNGTMNVSGLFTISGGTFDANSGTTVFDGTTVLTSNGAVFNNVTIGTATASGSLTLGDTADFDGNLSFNTTGGTAALILTNKTLNFGGSTFDLTNADTFTVTGSTVSFDGATTQTITPGTTVNTFNNLTIATSGGAVATLSTNNATVSNTFTVNSGAAFTVGSGVALTVSGTYTNNGTITETGTLKKAADSVKLTNSSGTEVTSYTLGTDSIYVTLTDADENKNGSSADTNTGGIITITASSGDSEVWNASTNSSYLGTETGNATGIFRNSIGFPLTQANSYTQNNGTLEAKKGDTLTVTYTDAEDSTDNTASDTSTTTATFTTSTTKLTNSSGTEQATYIVNADTVYVTITDGDENTDATTKQTVTGTVTSSSTNDSEALTLTETGNNTGIFRNTTGLTINTDNAATNNNSTLETKDAATITASYTDPDDSPTDSSSDTATINASTGIISLSISVLPLNVAVGEAVTYTATIQNTTSSSLTNFKVIAKLAPGFTYRSGTATWDSASLADPSGAGTSTLTFTIPSLAGSTTKTLKFIVTVGANVNPGKVQTSVYAQDQ